MSPEISEVLAVLNRIHAGEDVDFEEIQKLNWTVSDDIDPLMQRIYRELQMFASDEDIRRKDINYDKSWRRGLQKLHAELLGRL